MVAVVARVEAAGGIGTLEARGIYMCSVVVVGKGIPITLPVLTTTPSRSARPHYDFQYLHGVHA